MLLAFAGLVGVHHHIQLYSIEMGSHKLFLPVLAWNSDSPELSLSSS
jgi:hypothetical protein